MSNLIIGIDKGHAISGSVGASGILNEVTENRKIGNKLISTLKEMGHTVIDCSCDKANNSSEQLAGIKQKANAQKLDLFVSIHLNAGGGHGTESYVYSGAYPNKAQDKETARRVNSEVVRSCGFRDRGVKEGDFYVLRETISPAILVEVCFVDSSEDSKKINTDKIAIAMAEAITKSKYTPPAPPVSKPNTSGTMLRVVCGTFSDRKNAEDQQAKLKKAGFDSFLVTYNK